MLYDEIADYQFNTTLNLLAGGIFCVAKSLYCTYSLIDPGVKSKSLVSVQKFVPLVLWLTYGSGVCMPLAESVYRYTKTLPSLATKGVSFGTFKSA